MKTLFDKYMVTKKVGDTDPDAKYFVLRVDKDPHARIALAAYIKSIRRDEPEFARQLTKWLCAAVHTQINQWLIEGNLFTVTSDQLIALADGLLIQERPFSVREWCGAGKPFSGKQFARFRSELVMDEMLTMASEKDARRGFVLTDLGRALFGYFL